MKGERNATRAALANIARASRRRASGPGGVTITISTDDDEHDPDAEDWDKVDDDAPTFPGTGPRERKLRGRS